MRLPHIVKALLISALLYLTACTSLKSLIGKASIKNPEVSVKEIKIEGLSFSAADLVCNLSVKNPNTVSLRLSRFEYDLLVEDVSFISGKQETGLEIEADSESLIQLPLRLIYKNLYDTLLALAEKDAADYQLNLSFSFRVPVLGNVTIPVSKSGEFPLLRLPTISLKSLHINRLGFTNADLSIDILVRNPNPLSMDMSSLQYRLQINSREWVSGQSFNPMHINEKGEGLLSIPISLNFFQIGQSIYILLEQSQDLDYQLQGNLLFTTSIPLMGEVRLPFDRSGRIVVSR